MTSLLVLAAILMLISGLVKARAWSRVGRGLHVLPLTEILAGGALLALLLTTPPDPATGLWLVVGSVVLVVGSSALMTVGMRRHRRRRQLSEGARLATYVRYLSGLPRDD